MVLGQAEMCPAFYPTPEDFAQPFSQFIAKVLRQHPDVAMFKVAAPKGWKPRAKAYPNLGKIAINTPIKQHVFGTRGAYRCLFVEQKGTSAADFKKVACSEEHQASSKSFRQGPEDELLERAFWSSVTINPPLYGADTPQSFFDEKLPYGWNLRNLGCLLKQYDVPSIPGVTTPMTYFGMWKSFFSWHVEDADLFSINYLHFGAPKVWYCVSPKDRGKFDRMAQSLFPELHRNCSAFMRHKDIMLSPSLLRTYNIPFLQAKQGPGEFIVLNAGAYHSGFNLGFNCAEAVNFATKEWLQIGRTATRCRCAALRDGVRIDMGIFNPDWHESDTDSDVSDSDSISDEESSEDDSEDAESEQESVSNQHARTAKPAKPNGKRKAASVVRPKGRAPKQAKTANSPSLPGRVAKAHAAKAVKREKRWAKAEPEPPARKVAGRAGVVKEDKRSQSTDSSELASAQTSVRQQHVSAKRAAGGHHGRVGPAAAPTSRRGPPPKQPPGGGDARAGAASPAKVKRPISDAKLAALAKATAAAVASRKAKAAAKKHAGSGSEGAVALPVERRGECQTHTVSKHDKVHKAKVAVVGGRIEKGSKVKKPMSEAKLAALAKATQAAVVARKARAAQSAQAGGVPGVPPRAPSPVVFVPKRPRSHRARAVAQHLSTQPFAPDSPSRPGAHEAGPARPHASHDAPSSHGGAGHAVARVAHPPPLWGAPLSRSGDPGPVMDGPHAVVGEDPHGNKFFCLVHRLQQRATQKGNAVLGWLRQGRDGLFRPSDASWEEKQGALIPVRTQWIEQGSKREGGFKLLTLRSRILETELVD